MEDKLLAKKIVDKVIEQGATSSEVFLVRKNHLGVRVRSGELENSSRSIDSTVLIKAFVGKRVAIVSSFDFSEDTINELVVKVVKLAGVAEPDRFVGLPAKEEFKKTRRDLKIYYPEIKTVGVHEAKTIAEKLESSAKGTSKYIKMVEDAGCDIGWDKVIYANSHGFIDEYETSDAASMVWPIAEKNNERYVSGWYSLAHSMNDLEKPNIIGKKAAKRALRMVGDSEKVATTEAPIVFDPLIAATLLGEFAEAVSGTSIYKKASFLVNKIGKKVASKSVNIVDEGNMVGGLASSSFDGDGLPTRKTIVVKNGILKNYLLDTYSARRLKLKSTGSSLGSIAGPTNFYLKSGKHNPEDIIKSVKKGLYVTDLLGFGVNITNGNFSQGAAGIWIEDGKLTYPVKEITISGNLSDMFMNIDMIGNDLEMINSIFSPTIRISRMIISGK